jgi:hypothetical protein
MSDLTDIAARTQRFRDAVRAFTRPSPMRHAKLMPMKEGIIELRQKGASLRLIRELLATIVVAVSIDTIARFLAEVNGELTARRRTKNPGVGTRLSRRRATDKAQPIPRSPNRHRLDNRHLYHLHPGDHAFAVRASQTRTTSDSTHLVMNKQINLIINGKGGVGKSFFATTFVQISQRLRHRSLRDRHRARELDAQALPSTIGVHQSRTPS